MYVYFHANIEYYISMKGGEDMTEFEQMDALAEKHGGVLRTADVLAQNISRVQFERFLKERQYEKAVHGIYMAPDAWKDAAYLLQLRCPQVIFSHDSALFAHDLTDREPMQLTVTLKTGYNPSRLTADGIKVFTIKSELHEMGLTETVTTFGNPVRTYDPERTICDIVRSKNTMETQVFQDALKQYVRRKDKNLHRLMEYAEPLRVKKILQQYMGILL